jgi:hypothetical protein
MLAILRLVFLTLLAVFLTGCGAKAITPPAQRDVEQHLAKMRKSARVFYFAGREFEGLPLTGAIYESRHDVGLFIYGTCEIPPGQAGGCAPPVQIQIFRFNPTQWARAMGCHQKPGRPARHSNPIESDFKKSGLLQHF